MVEARHLRRVVKTRPEDASDEQPYGTPCVGTAEPYAEDKGLVGLLKDLKFDPDNDQSLRCPSCGEEIAIDKGLCPVCHELIRAKDPYSLEARVLPMIDARNVVYVHLDVAKGDLRFMRKTASQQRIELMEVHIEGIPGELPDSCNP